MTPDSVVSAGFEAAFAWSGLPAVSLGQPTQLTLRLLNQGPASYLTPLAEDEASRARLVLTLGALGATLAGAVPDAPPGFRFAVDPDGTTLTLWQTAPQWQWFAGEALEVPLPTLTFAGPEGLRRLPLTLSHLAPQQAASLSAVLACLDGPVPAAEPAAGSAAEVPPPHNRAVGDEARIDLFTATPPSLSGVAAPTPVRLSWQVSNADYVTITGLGKVAAQGRDVLVNVERTTTFVLAAYSAGLGQLVTEKREVAVTPAPLPAFVPVGVIMLWNGEQADIPPGWKLCDGGDGRPDLRDRFVLGAGGRERVNAKGDADTHTHQVEEYEEVFRTDEAGEHMHLLNLPKATPGHFATAISTGNMSGFRLNDTGPAGKHSHRVNVRISASTTSEARASRPDWYALYYIIKVSN